MSAPKSVVKLHGSKTGSYVEYTSNVDQSQYYIYELTRAALRDVGKYCKRMFKEAYYGHFHRWTGNGGKVTGYKVISGKSTQYPRVQIGLPQGAKPGFYSYFQEIGTSKQPKLGLLQGCVQDNVAEIVKIESQYLSALEGEAAELEALISEDDYEDDGSDEA